MKTIESFNYFFLLLTLEVLVVTVQNNKLTREELTSIAPSQSVQPLLVPEANLIEAAVQRSGKKPRLDLGEEEELSEEPGGKTRVFPELGTSKLQPVDKGAYYTSEVLTENGGFTLLGAFTNGLKSEGVPICAAILLSREYALTGASCCANVGVKRNDFTITRYFQVGTFATDWLGFFEYTKYTLVVKLIYMEEFLEFSDVRRCDLCLIQMNFWDTSSLSDKLPLVAWPKYDRLTEQMEIAKAFPTKKSAEKTGCFLYGYQLPDWGPMIAIPVRPLYKSQCIQKGRIPRIDEFCATPLHSVDIPVSIGAFCICDGYLVGVMSNDGLYKRPSEQRIFIFTRIDHYKDFITTQMNYWPRTTATDRPIRITTSVPEEPEEDSTNSFYKTTTVTIMPLGDPPEEQTKAWEFLIKMLKTFTILLILMIILSLVIRLIRRCYRKCYKKAAGWNCCLIRLLSRCDKCYSQSKGIEKINYRLVLPFYMVIMTVLMYMFEKEYQTGTLKRRKKKKVRV